MIFHVQFGSACNFFQRPQIALALRVRVILLIFGKIYSCLFIPNCTRNNVITYTNNFSSELNSRHDKSKRGKADCLKYRKTLIKKSQTLHLIVQVA